MCAARRKPANKGLERNLTTHPQKGFRWKDPRSKKYVYFGKACSRAEAIDAARRLNLECALMNSVYDKVAAGASTSIRKLVDRHLQHLGQSLNDRTKSNRHWEFQKLAREIGDWNSAGVDTRQLSEYLDGLVSNSQRAHYRARLCELFDTAVCDGYAKSNPARSLRKYPIEVRRARLTLEAFEAVRQVAAPWLQNAMDLGLHTLQRRDDLVSLRWTADTGTALRIEQGKTGRRLEIATSPAIRAILTRCRDQIHCPFVLHRLPEKARPSSMRAAKREHFAQILPEQLTRAFADALSKSGLPIGAGKTPPTFHEIRSLGIALYREMGWSDERVQALAGHADVAMTRHYMEGHEAPWQPVESGLEIRRKRY